MPDWVAALDDGLTERLRHCTACGVEGGSAWFDIVDVPDGPSVAMRQCHRCRASDPHLTSLVAHLVQRYQRGGAPG